MQNQDINRFFSEWSDQLIDSLAESNSLCLALFSAEKELLFATPAMILLFKGKPSESLINPTFDQLLEIESVVPLIFEGILTIGDYSSINSSIVVRVYLKENKLLIVGGADVNQLFRHNAAMHDLNRQISNLQRQSLKEKFTLENTLIELSDANDALHELNSTKDKFFSIIAHDLKGPFGGFVELTKIIAEKLPDMSYDEIQKYTQVMKKSASGLYHLLENLLEWSRMQRGLITFNPSFIVLNIKIMEILFLANQDAAKKEITITNSIPENLLVYADDDMLGGIIRNLVTNAVKFTPKGGCIEISAAIGGNNAVELCIKDSGIGMKKEIIDNLFELDVNTSRKGTEGESSTGLGLIICKDFIEKHGGELWIESEEEKGCVFHVIFPANKA